MKSLLASLVGVLSLLVSPTISIPFNNTDYTDNSGCSRSINRYFLLVDAAGYNPNYNVVNKNLLRNVGVGLLREADSSVILCSYNNGGFYCSDKWLTTEESIHYEIEQGNHDNYNSNGGISELRGALIYCMEKIDKEIPTKMIIMNNNPNVNNPISEIAKRIRDSGVEIFGMGRRETMRLVSSPYSSYFIETNDFSESVYPYSDRVEANFVASDLLAIVLKQKSVTCSAWGFGRTHVSTFDGNIYNFDGVGDYTLFHSMLGGENSLLVQIRQTTRPNNEDINDDRKTQIRTVSVTHKTFNYQSNRYESHIYIFNFDPELDVVTTKYKEEIDDQFQELRYYYDYSDNSWIPNFKRYGNGNIIYIRYGIHTPDNSHQINFFTKNGETVKIYFSDYASAVTVRATTNDYFASNGLCGFYDGCPSNDFMLKNKVVMDYEKVLKKEDLMKEFIEDWRVKFIESHLDLKNFENHLPSENWKPFKSNKNYKNADLVCSHLPSSLKDLCEFDVGARQHLYASLVTRYLAKNVCKQYCSNPSKKFHDFWEVETLCKTECRSKEREVDIHFKYNTTYDLNDQIEDTYSTRGTYSSLLFKSNVNMGGRYTFNLMSRDLCYDYSRNISFRITCDEPPVVKAHSFFNSNEELEENKIDYTYGFTGLPVVNFFGSVEGIKKDYRFSWKVINASFPLYKDESYTEEDYPEEDRIEDASETLFNTITLNPYFEPPWAGLFIIELAVNDGCQVTKSQVTLNITCSKCLLNGHVNSYQKLRWIKNTFNVNGQWPNQQMYFTITEGSKDYMDYYYYYWKFVSKSGSLIKKVDDRTYDVYNLKRASTIVSDRQYSIVDDPSTPVETERDTWDPFEQNVSPYVIPELGVMKLKYEWSQFTTYYREIVTTPEEIENVCRVQISNSGTWNSQPSWSFTEQVNLNTDLAKCPGYYNFEVEVYDGCDNTRVERSVKDTYVIHLDCDLPPIAYLSCSQIVDFNYASGTFPSVDLDGTETYDPREGSSTNGNQLVYSWDINSKPQASTAKITSSNSRTNSFTPDTKGTYTISLTASNQCNKDVATVQVEAKCVNPPAITTSSVPPTISYNGTLPQFSLQTNAVHDFPASIRYNWMLFQSPSYPEIYDFYPAPTLLNSNAATATLRPTISGVYSVGVFVTDRCQPATNQNITVSLNCETTATSTIATIPPTINYNYTSFSFPSVNLDATSSSITGAVSYTPVPRHKWFLVSAPGKSTWSSLSTSATTTYSTFSMGSYRIRHAFTDECKYTHSDVTFNVDCPNPAPIAVPQVTQSSNLRVGSLVTVQETASPIVNGPLYWILQDPKGKNISSVYNLYNITFTPTLPGRYLVFVEATDGCKTGFSSLAIDILCPTIDYTPTPQINSPVSLYSKGKFAKVTINDAGTNLGSTYIVSEFLYRWIVTAAPRGSAFEPYDRINSTQIITILPAAVNATFNRTSYQVETKYWRDVRYAEIYAAQEPEKIFSACFHPDIPGTYRVRLQISPDSFSLDDPCYSKNSTDLTVEARCNGAPVISVPDQTVELKSNKFDRITIDASTSTSDPDGDPITYSWKFVEDYEDKLGYEPILSQFNSPVISFVVFVQGSYKLELTVTDGCSTVTKIITVSTVCTAPELTTPKDKKTLKKEEEMRNIEVQLGGKDISFSDFEYFEKQVSESCTGMFEVELVSYDNTDIVGTVPFTKTGGFIATVVIVPIVGVALIAVAGFFIYKFVGGSAAKSPNVKMEAWN